MFIIYFILSGLWGAVTPVIAPIFSAEWWAIASVPHLFFVIGRMVK